MKQHDGMLATALRLDPVFKRHLGRYFGIGAVFYVLAALVQTTFYHPDQHFQTLELARFKTRPASEHLLPWEYHARIRPWMQPAIYAGAITAFEAVGLKNPFHQDRLLRLASAILGLCATLLFCITLAEWLPLDAQRKWLAIIFGLYWAFPTLHTRTSSENLSSIFLLLGVSALFLLRRDRGVDPRRKEPGGPFVGPMVFTSTGLVWSGLFLGLSFDFRYQMGIASGGLLLWMGLVMRVPLRQLVLVGVSIGAMIGAGLLVDWWGYGVFEVTPWNYFRSNLIEGQAAAFGTNPWYYYFVGLLIYPMGIILLGAGLLFGVRRPRNLLTWMTWSFVLVHLMLAHKEMRFLSPLTHLTLAMAVFLIPSTWYAAGNSENPFMGHARWARRAFYVFAAINLLALVGGSLRGPRMLLTTHKFIYNEYPDNFEFYSLGPSPFIFGSARLSMEFYAPRHITHHTLNSMTDLATILPGTRELIWYHDGERVSASPEWVAFHEYCTLIHQPTIEWIKQLNRLVRQWRYKRPTSLYRCRQTPR